LRDEPTTVEPPPRIMTELSSTWYDMPKLVSLRALRDAPVLYLFTVPEFYIETLRNRFKDLEFEIIRIDRLTFIKVHRRGSSAEPNRPTSGGPLPQESSAETSRKILY
jgi:hypothetical protein